MPQRAELVVHDPFGRRVGLRLMRRDQRVARAKALQQGIERTQHDDVRIEIEHRFAGVLREKLLTERAFDRRAKLDQRVLEDPLPDVVDGKLFHLGNRVEGVLRRAEHRRHGVAEQEVETGVRVEAFHAVGQHPGLRQVVHGYACKDLHHVASLLAPPGALTLFTPHTPGANQATCTANSPCKRYARFACGSNTNARTTFVPGSNSAAGTNVSQPLICNWLLL